MSFSRVAIGITLCLFLIIGVLGWVKKRNKEQAAKPKEVILVSKKEEKPVSSKKESSKTIAPVVVIPTKSLLPEVDRVSELFDVSASKLSSIVETITYKAKVSWLQGRPAWIADYASHFGTSRHFIARSLNRTPDYLTQKVTDGDTFNVFRKDKEINFQLLIDISCCKMFFYCYNATDDERILLKTYDVGLGRLDPNSLSGCLTPLGKYSLGNKVVIYKPGSLGLFHSESVEMVKIFGTRWIPFDKEIEGCSAPSKGYGIHGAPWIDNKENLECISKYESDGCIRLATKDVEELFAIVITKPTVVEIVKNHNRN